ncbi:MAG: class I SAM-dependent methyltransferase [Patescibacteria group bacterium]
MKYNEFFMYQCKDCKVQFFWGAKNPGAHWYEETSDYEIKNVIGPKIYRGSHKKFLQKYLQFPAGTAVLELGCGSGEFIAELEKRGYTVFGVDFDRKGIELAKKYFGLKNVFAEPFEGFFKRQNLPLFDYVVFFEVIEHVQDPLKFIKSAKKLLKPGGKMIISTPSRERMLANWNNWDFPPHHLTRWNKEAISNLFSKINFEISDFCYVEQFKMIMGAIDGRFRSGLAARTASNSIENKKSSLLAKVLYILAKIKMYLIGFVPAFFLWTFGRLTGRNNGIMFVELQINRDTNIPACRQAGKCILMQPIIRMCLFAKECRIRTIN